MSVTESKIIDRKLRLLVSICSYGEKNLPYLKRIIQTYQSMPMSVDVVVLSEAPKDLGDGIKVVVGLPSNDPWSLPFAHKAIFAREVENYDLFIYSEDDILCTERNLRAFLRATPHLAPDEIAGFLHYEQDESGKIWMVGVHGHFHWKAESVRRRGNYSVAEFTNEHSAFYLLTQTQLRRAIASGGFLREPREGLYDLLCTAATDPYTSCGFRKVICVSALEDFLIHHMPNKYVDQLDVSLTSLRRQGETLLDIGDGRHPACNLFAIEPKFWHFWWQKSYYEHPEEQLLQLVPGRAKEILSVGCGWGATEEQLQQRGARVTALPLDSVIGVVAAHRVANVIYGTWEQCLTSLVGQRFDCVIMTDLVHLHPNPGLLVEQCSRFVRQGGTLVLSGPNFDRLPWWIKRVCGTGEFRKLRRFDLSGISACGPRSLAIHIGNSGFRTTQVKWLNHSFAGGSIRGSQVNLGRLTGRDWALQARRELS